MMTKIIECIPNFSEGRNDCVIELLVKTATQVTGVTLVDYSSDKSHNRSVFTLIGHPDGICEAAFLLAKAALENIDLTKQKGEHPRMGAVDVIPFVPLKNATMEDCVLISNMVGKRIGEELGIPVFLYEHSQPQEYRKNLADIRRGQFEGMQQKIENKEWYPDYGKNEIHPTAGVVAVGGRMPLIAFNANLSTSDVNVANAIARAVRASSGGLRSLKAIGVMLDEKTAQVSMNIVNSEDTPLYRALELVKIEAKRFGVYVTQTELIGLASSRSLIDSAAYYLQIKDFDYNRHVLENYY